MSRANVACAEARMQLAAVPAGREILSLTCRRRQTIACRNLWSSSPPLPASSKGRRQFLSAFCSPLKTNRTPSSLGSKQSLSHEKSPPDFSLRICFCVAELLRGAGLRRHLAHHQRKTADRNLSVLNKHDRLGHRDLEAFAAARISTG